MIRDSESNVPEDMRALGYADYLAVGREVLAIEADTLKTLERRLDHCFADTVNTILGASGRVIVSGMGKSGLIGKKISATFASTGTPSFFMHPAEAFHGDLGMVAAADVFFAISNSGETEELVNLLPYLRDNGNKVIALTGHQGSTLAQHASVHLAVSVEREACPLQLAPTASTTAALAMGDALAVALMKARNFNEQHFARFHPGGSLGRRLLRRVSEEMQTEDLPFIHGDAGGAEILSVVDRGRLGIALVVNQQGQLLGIITDGDLRRALLRHREAFFGLTASSLMTRDPVTTTVDTGVSAAIELMTRHRITHLVVIEGQQVVGVLQK